MSRSVIGMLYCSCLVVLLSTIIFCNGQLEKGGINVVEMNITERYTTCCTHFIICLNWCTRDRQRTIYVCKNGYENVTETDTGCPKPLCTECPNGGTCVLPFHCSCPTGFYSPDCTRCNGLSNCDAVNCTNSNDQKCYRCSYSYGQPTKYEHNAYLQTATGRCQQLCSWRDDSKQCYPGSCSDNTSASCVCAYGYTGTDCMTINSQPDITHCIATARTAKNEVVENQCIYSNTPKYTNLDLNKLEIHWKAQFKGPKKKIYPLPYYISKFTVGIVQARFTWEVTRGESYSVMKRGVISCNLAASQDNPATSLVDCSLDTSALTLDLMTGDRLRYTVEVENGGHLHIKNFDNGKSNPTTVKKHYKGAVKKQSGSFYIDITLPRHCLYACGINTMIEHGLGFITQPNIDLKWSGWTDEHSGIAGYEFELYQLKAYGDSLAYKTSAIWAKTFPNSANPLLTFALPGSGLFCILLVVNDTAGNHRYARRFVMFDNSSKVEISSHIEDKIYVKNAAQNTSYLWITTVTNQVNLQWKGHFFNEMHRSQKLLNAISPDASRNIEASYEERDGFSLTRRSMQAISQVNGVVQFQVAHRVDHKGGRSITTAATFHSVSNFQREEVSLTISRSDGDSIRFWVKASDIMNQTITDEILVHVDSSPPHIESIGLVRNGHKSLVVHNSLDLFDLNLEFDTYDYHSGLKQLHWELHDKNNPSVVHGDGHLPVHKTNNASCYQPACYCIPKGECFHRTYNIIPNIAKMNISVGNHDFDYFFVITATNNAMLQSLMKFQITIDSSPPLPGHVYDSPPGHTDVDYQAHFTIRSSWYGFFDRESSIMLYKYAILPYCLNIGGFENNTEVLTTRETFSERRVTTAGKYFTTVIAYNHAQEPSPPVCSDGVTIDTTPPKISSVFIDNTFRKPGLAKDSSNEVKFIDTYSNVYDLDHISSPCSETATVLPYLHLLNTKQFPKPHRPNQHNCTIYDEAGKKAFFVNENLLNFTWSGLDADSGIFDFEVGLASTSSANADIMPLTSTHGRGHFITYHPNLVNRQGFYIQLKAIDKAGNEKQETIGPLEVRISGPVFTPVISIIHQLQDDSWLLLANWDQSSWDLDDISDGFLTLVEYALGENNCNGKIQEWTKIDDSFNSQKCQWKWPPTCIAIAGSKMRHHLHDGKSYCLFIRATAVNGLSTESSTLYRHAKHISLKGTLIEVNLNYTLAGYDVDYQTDLSAIAVKFIGEKVSSEVKTFIGVGTEAGQDNIDSFKPINLTAAIIFIDNLQLQTFQKYFVSLKAISDSSQQSFIMSDGLTILPEKDVLLEHFIVYDGLPCQYNITTSSLELNHHSDLKDIPNCGKDIDYQPYTTSLSAFWVGNVKTKLVTNFQVQVEMQNKSNEEWVPYGRLHRYSVVDNVVLTGMYLQGGLKYRLSIQPCHPITCYKSVKTDGVIILPLPPIAGSIVEAEYNNTNNSIAMKWRLFHDPYLGADTAVINQYQVALFVQPGGDERYQLNEWTTIPWAELTVINNQQIGAVVSLTNYTLEASSCIEIGLRGYNKALMNAVIYKELLGCDLETHHPLNVLDAAGEISSDGTVSDIFLAANDRWPHPDIEFTPTKSSLSAVWPSVRNNYIKWKVVNGAAMKRKSYLKSDEGHLSYSDFDCTSSDVLACGSTENRYINIHDLVLQEGSRYHVCIFAKQISLSHEKWIENLPEISSCSNGVVVDNHPPLAGKVWIGHQQKHTNFQTDSFTLVVHWNGFIDVESHGNTVHHSGIKKYYLEVGSSRGGAEVIEFTNIGLTNNRILTDLSLINGKSYYATIKAVDYTGHETLVSSDSVTIDNSKPNTDASKLYMDGDFLTTEKIVTIRYLDGTFTDKDSGISHYYWCIGSTHLDCDVIPMTELSTTHIEIQLHHADFSDGQKYWVHIQAVNGAGLSSTVTTNPFVVDKTLPTTGYVNDVTTSIYDDADYQFSASTLSVAWGGFYDPHTYVVEYRLSIVKASDGSNVLNDHYMGLKTEYIVENLNLIPGETYYSKITACNGANMCRVVMSDGILVDNSPPHIGKVVDGTHGADIDYQASVNIISAHLDNIHDMQSGISAVHWWAGTSNGSSDILNETLSHNHRILHTQLKHDIQVGSKVFVTVKVCNKVDLCTVKSTDGVTVDTTAPAFNNKVTLSQTIGSMRKNTQIYKSTMRLEWNVEDTISPITTVYVSVLSSNNVHFLHPTIKVLGRPGHYMLSNLSLNDGDICTTKVLACNRAQLCTSNVSEPILVDSSPPTSGAFGVDTEHAFELNRHRSSWMEYYNNQSGSYVKLTWVGFQDPHSDIHSYSIRIGTTLHSADLSINETEFTVTHQSDEKHKDEGYLQQQVVEVQKTLNPNDVVYVSITATNGVGLNSSILYGELEAIPSGNNSGILNLNRHCQLFSCFGHCSCAPHGDHICDVTNEDSCMDIPGNISYAMVTVHDVTPSLHMDSSDVDFVPSENIIAAAWTVGSIGIQAAWFDWSVGIEGLSPGGGLLDSSTQPIWYEAGRLTSAIFSTSESNIVDKFLSHLTYVFYVRTWYSADTYAIFKSNGVKIDPTPPATSRSFKVTEAGNSGSAMDQDFISSPSTLTISWKNVFREFQSEVLSFKIQLISDKDLENIVDISVMAQSNVTLYNLTLEEGKLYHSVITACNKASLCSSVSSDGFLVDTSAPVIGTVCDGIVQHDVTYTSDNMSVSASWKAFFDDESFIDYYIWCVGSAPQLEDIHSCENVGLHLKKKAILQNPISNGVMVYSTVIAVNGAGLSSIKVASNGVKIDATPPKPINHFKLGDNIISYPDFVNKTKSNWKISTANNSSLYQLGYVCITEGYIMQNLTVQPKKKYKVSFKARSGSVSSYTVLGYIKFGNNYHQFSEGRTFHSFQNSYYSFQFYFTIGDNNFSVLQLGTIGHASQICLNDIEVKPLIQQNATVSTSFEEKSIIDIHISAPSTLVINWDFEDLESPIVNYLLAVGTVKGGVQLQDYKSTGVRSTSTITNLVLPHGLKIYVSVVAENAAGLSSILYSDPVTVDVTPPVISVFKVNKEEMFITSRSFKIEWISWDQESGVSKCQFFAGSNINTDDVLTTIQLSDKGKQVVTTETNLKHNDQLYCHLVCISFANLISRRIIGPVTMISEPSYMKSSSINIVPFASSFYASTHNYLSEAEMVWLRLDGIPYDHNFDECKLNIKDGNNYILQWHTTGTRQYHILALKNGSLFEEKTYILNLKCLNKGKFESRIISTNFTLEKDAPQYRGITLGIYWPDDATVDLDWTGLFTSSSAMTYEVHLGTTRGGSDVLAWKETKDSKIVIKPIDSSKVHHFSVTAISRTGLYVTRSFEVSYG